MCPAYVRRAYRSQKGGLGPLELSEGQADCKQPCE